ncbi:putative MxaS-like protein [Paraburkholderia ribeironis]|uniref:Putative MxaS-like protein n=1 Tax=Paraburkholderia ribeironis TaxID=1247936 RepID=A0A1N7S8R1_9BURK|nr:DUF58 domain-containing protein [Paraburkholderia ribeironis]SIT43767.1 putative MxaS-like protein [Paraburkholderia ribeironis]
MNTVHEFHYRITSRISGHRPGSHRGASLGAGQEFAAHARLFDSPDPRRLDLRASLRNVREEWLVRTYRQRAAVSVHAVIDVSPSMHFGSSRSKLEVVGDFVASLGRSAFRVGDPVGMLAFDTVVRDDLSLPPTHSRGIGLVMQHMLRNCRQIEDRKGSGGAGCQRSLARLAGRPALVFLVSDFHWSLDVLPTLIASLASACIVPIVVWDPAELEPPSRNALLMLRDMESGQRRTLWRRPGIEVQWRDAVIRRRAELDTHFAGRSMRPFYAIGTFDPEALSRYFFESIS